jgi:hypothetical protein
MGAIEMKRISKLDPATFHPRTSPSGQSGENVITIVDANGNVIEQGYYDSSTGAEIGGASMRPAPYAPNGPHP